MRGPHACDGEFPDHGARARRFARFERDLAAWLDTPEGQFAVWHADWHRQTPAVHGRDGHAGSDQG